MTPSSLTFTRHDAASAESIIEGVIVPLYEATHGDRLEDPFYSSQRFAERVRSYFRAPGFEIVVAYLEEIPVGQAFGYSLPANARWWKGLTTPVPDGFTDETGDRTFALNELMVIPERQGQGIAHALHDELLRGRHEERATLLVREDNTSAQEAYRRWGWEKIGKLRPFEDAPNFDSLVVPIPR
ncbi:GNAT family N-acetyltransferase [Spirillospora sp. CA-294931]|uniref:GNAT family N-acetyltransferase n=1 Tax=Spirillospora sp. CA-294931 TaxID=3240042 RepID=UPI003D8C5B3B